MSIIITTIAIALSIAVIILVSIVYNKVIEINSDLYLREKRQAKIDASQELTDFLDSCFIVCDKSICDKKNDPNCDRKEETEWIPPSFDKLDKNSAQTSLIQCYINCISRYTRLKKGVSGFIK